MIIICGSEEERSRIHGNTLMQCHYVFVKHDDQHYKAWKNRWDNDNERLFTIPEVAFIIEHGRPSKCVSQ